jgi:hypothetical protein
MKRGNPTLKKRESKTKTKLRSSLNNNNHLHIQGPSTGMGMTTYHNVPIDFFSFQQRVENNMKC